MVEQTQRPWWAFWRPEPTAQDQEAIVTAAKYRQTLMVQAAQSNPDIALQSAISTEDREAMSDTAQAFVETSLQGQTGQLILVMVDVIDENDELKYLLIQNSGISTVHFAGVKPGSLDQGLNVETGVQGTINAAIKLPNGDVVMPTDGLRVASTPPTAQSLSVTGTKTVGIIRFRSDGGIEPPSDATVESLGQQLADYYRRVSYGQLNLSVQVADTVATLDGQLNCNAAPFRRNNLVDASGLGQKDYYIYVSSVYCSNGILAWANLPDSHPFDEIFVYGGNSFALTQFTFVHEFGHNLGYEHELMNKSKLS